MQPLPRDSMLRILVLSLWLAASSAVGLAQSAQLRVSAVVLSGVPDVTDTALQFESLSPPREVSRTAAFVEFSISVVISGNVPYRVSVTNGESAKVVTARNADGQVVRVGSEPVVVLRGVSVQAGSHHEFRYRVAADQATAVAALAVTLEASRAL